MRLPAFTRRDTTHQLGAIGNGLLGMECPLLAGKTLANHFCIFVYKNTHMLLLIRMIGFIPGPLPQPLF